MYGGPFFPEHM